MMSGSTKSAKSIRVVIFLELLILTVFVYYCILDKSLTESEVHQYKSHSKDNSTSPHLALPHHYDHHNLLMDQHVQERIKDTNSSHYTWLGNQWIPPPGIPIFTPKQIKEYYSGRNILVIGDSTSRRLHATLLAILNAVDLDNVPLKEVMQDANKGKNSCDANSMGHRYITNRTAGIFTICRNTTIEVEETANETSTGDGGSVKYFSFDQIYQVCYAAISNLWRDVEEDESTSSTTSASLNEDLVGFQQDYDLVIVANGIWELARKRDCDKQSPPGTTTEERLQRTLDNLEKNNPDGLHVVFRTSGWDKKYFENDSTIRNANALTRQFFNDLDQQSELGRYRKNLTLVDWGGVMESRSYNKERIEGDMAAHYGIEARLLFIQQLTHELVKSELIARDVEMRKDEATTVLVQSNPSVRRK